MSIIHCHDRVGHTGPLGDRRLIGCHLKQVGETLPVTRDSVTVVEDMATLLHLLSELLCNEDAILFLLFLRHRSVLSFSPTNRTHILSFIARNTSGLHLLDLWTKKELQQGRLRFWDLREIGALQSVCCVVRDVDLKSPRLGTARL